LSRDARARLGDFYRRFLRHGLPRGFHRIRHYGLLVSAGGKANITRAKELIGIGGDRDQSFDGRAV
jgi:hypothetical protein